MKRSMQASKILPAVLAVIAVLSFAGTGRSRDATANRVQYAVLGSDDGPLRGDFNHDRGDVRLVFLVDPICPESCADWRTSAMTSSPTWAPVRR